MKFAHFTDLMYYIVINYIYEEIHMKGIVNFLKEIFTFSNNGPKIVLSQFKMAKELKRRPEVKKVVNQTSEVKLSDLMRRSY